MVTTDIMVNSSLSGRLILLGNVYEKLLVLDDEGEVRPELCSSWSISEDCRSLSFVLRDDVKFHNGKVMTSQDVAKSMNRWLEVYGKAREMVGEASFIPSEGVITITSNKSLTFLPYLIASSPQAAVIYPEDSLEGGSDLVFQAPGTGPYKLDEWSNGEKVVLKKYDGYRDDTNEAKGLWGEKKASFGEIDYFFVSDSTTRLLGLMNGEYDFINDLMSDDRALVEGSSSLRIVEGEESGLIALVFNKNSGPMCSESLRKAVSLSLDPEELMKSCYGDYGWSLHSDYMEREMSAWSVVEDNPYYGLNGEKAAEQLSSSDYKGETIRILTSNLSNLERIAYAAESEMEKIGLNTEVVVTDWAGMMEKRKDPSSWDIFISAFSKVPLPQMKSFLSPTYPGWMEEESDAYKAYIAINEAQDIQEAQRMWEEVQGAMWEYIPVYVAGHYTTAYAVRKDLEGVIYQDGFHFWNAYFSNR